MKVLPFSFFYLIITISFFFKNLEAHDDNLLNRSFAVAKLNEIERGECKEFNDLSLAKQNFYRNYFKELANNDDFSSSSSLNPKYDFTAEKSLTDFEQKKVRRSFFDWFNFSKKKS